MLRKYKTSKYLDRILSKLIKKDKKLYENVMNKLHEVIISTKIEHYKNLKYPLQHLKRVQIGEKVLVFKFDKKSKLISFENFKHHDKIYLK